MVLQIAYQNQTATYKGQKYIKRETEMKYLRRIKASFRTKPTFIYGLNQIQFQLNCLYFFF